MRKKIAILICVIVMLSMLLQINTVFAYPYKGVCGIKGNTISYKNNVDEEYMVNGGYRKVYKIKLAKNAKFYWYKPRTNPKKYSRISKKTFIKRLKYRYRAETNTYQKKRSEIWQICTFKIKKGKIAKIYAEYSS